MGYCKHLDTLWYELIELPSLIDEGETLEAAKRELKEETGYGQIRMNSFIFTSAGCHDEMLYIYTPRYRKGHGQDLDSGEILTYTKFHSKNSIIW